MMPRITSADLLVAAVIVALLAVFALIYLAVVPGDPFPEEEPRPEGADGLGERPAEIAHDGCPFGPAPRPATETSPDAPPVRALIRGAGAPGTVAAAGDLQPPPEVPPLPPDGGGCAYRDEIPLPQWIDAHIATNGGA